LVNKYFRVATYIWVLVLLGGVLNFATQVFIAKSLVREDFGAITFAIGIANIFASLGGFGAGSYWLKVFGKAGYRALSLVPGTIVYCGVASLISVATYLLFLEFTALQGSVWAACVFLLVLVPTQGLLDLTTAKLQLQGRLVSLAMLQLFPHLLRFLAVFIAVQIFEVPRVLNIAAAIALSSAIMLSVCSAQIWGMLKPSFQLEGHFNRQKNFKQPSRSRIVIFHVFSESWSFGSINFLHLTQSLSGTILIFYLFGSEDVAIFSVAMLFILAVYSFPSVLFTKVLAASMHRRLHYDKDGLISDYHLASKFLLVLGISVATILFAFAPFIVHAFFGSAYNESAELIKILSISIPFHFVSVAFDTILMTGNAIFKKIKIMLFLVALNVSLSLVGSAFFGVTGVAIAFVCTHVTALVLYLGVYRNTFIQPA
jgi:O-antigen/teichoic acid export membrane protein